MRVRVLGIGLVAAGVLLALALAACVGGGGTRELNYRIYGSDCPTIAFGRKVLEVRAPDGKLLVKIRPKRSVEHYPVCNLWFRTTLPPETYYELSLIGQTTSWSDIKLGPPNYGLHSESGVPDGHGGEYHVVATLVRR